MFASGNDFFLPGFQFLARNNLINKVHDETFQGVELTDTILDLRYNRLTTLSPDFQSPRGVEALRFSNNPWHCDCNLRWIIAKDRFLVNHTALDPPNCQTPVSLRGHPIFTLREEEFTCLPYREGSLQRDIPGASTDFTLTCPVTADPPNPEISWTVWLPCPTWGQPLQFDFTSEIITLSDITTNPRAAFRCTATNNCWKYRPRPRYTLEWREGHRYSRCSFGTPPPLSRQLPRAGSVNLPLQRNGQFTNRTHFYNES
ncbi:Protein slit [Holothuria leucospilota]|uniref:Protein slit n=1 Tax=Holothuria leucospilota TaxID=206669 RepID=A0A9Q1BF89_HOLLE|nr:Protein slit [Holothuria leucospilota]